MPHSIDSPTGPGQVTTARSASPTGAPNDVLPTGALPDGALPDGLRLGPVRLAVTDLDRSVDFYTRVLGVTVAARGREGAHDLAHLAADGGDVVVLQEEPGARRAGRHAGLYHVAYNVASRLDLARALQRVADGRMPIDGATDHGTHEALYLRDPDGNGLELAWDCPPEQWPRTAEQAVNGQRRLDLQRLLALTAGEPLAPRAAPGLRVGHVHLHVGDVRRAVDFYVGLVGFALQFDLGTAAFMSAGGYHHHLATNVWRGQDAPPPPADVVGLRAWEIDLPTAADVEAVRARLTAGSASVAPADAAGTPDFTTADPWGIPLRVAVDQRRR